MVMQPSWTMGRKVDEATRLLLDQATGHDGN